MPIPTFTIFRLVPFVNRQFRLKALFVQVAIICCPVFVQFEHSFFPQLKSVFFRDKVIFNRNDQSSQEAQDEYGKSGKIRNHQDGGKRDDGPGPAEKQPGTARH
jgi:hypothetical protein